MADHHLDRLTDWEFGLPAAHDLTPLSQPLIPPDLASAFSISPLSHRTTLDVTRASRSTLSTLRASANNNNTDLILFPDPAADEPDLDDDDDDQEIDLNGAASDSRKLRKIDFAAEEADSAPRTDSAYAAAVAVVVGGGVKRPRLVWTPQLHKRFVDVVAHLGIKNAVPKTIMQLMNVEGLTRENVASHLQKYRLYLKRMHGISADGPSSSDPLFASTPLPQSFSDGDGNGNADGHSRGNGHHLPVPIPYPYPPTVMPMPMVGHGYENLPNHPYNMIQQRDWSANKYAPAVSYHHHNDK